jgi:broad specificity phosphatase PhoE
MAIVTRWWWIRHAPVIGNNGCCYGQTDFPCDVSDTPAFTSLGSKLPSGAVWVTSPLQRTYLTAAALVAAGAPGPSPIPGPDVLVEDDLIEQNFGSWQGVSYAELAARHASDGPRLWLGPAHETPPGGENFISLSTRVHRAIGDLNDRFAGRDIIAVTHGGTIRAALGKALALAPETSLAFSVDNLSLTRLDHFPEAPPAESWRVAGANLPP